MDASIRQLEPDPEVLMLLGDQPFSVKAMTPQQRLQLLLGVIEKCRPHIKNMDGYRKIAEVVNSIVGDRKRTGHANFPTGLGMQTPSLCLQGEYWIHYLSEEQDSSHYKTLQFLLTRNAQIVCFEAEYLKEGNKQIVVKMNFSFPSNEELEKMVSEREGFLLNQTILALHNHLYKAHQKALARAENIHRAMVGIRGIDERNTSRIT